jgi:UDP-galactopyranose mutase
MAIILMSFGNKEEEICYPIQKKTSSRLLRNQEETNITGSEKTLQIISQNETRTSIVMTCDSSVINEQGATFSIEGPYVLNCKDSRVFNYIDKVTLWTDGTCSGTKKYPDFPSHLPVQNHSTTITDYFDYCGWWKYWCRTAVACIPSDYITLQRCFWEERKLQD